MQNSSSKLQRRKKLRQKTLKQSLNLETSITQARQFSTSEPTELGTLYTAAEIKTLADLMHKHGCYLHVDGSRIANAAAALKMPIKNLLQTQEPMCFHLAQKRVTGRGGCCGFECKKNKIFADSLMYYRKQATQLYSKTGLLPGSV